MPLIELLFCITLVFCSAFLSASEVALFSLSRFQIRSLKERAKTIHNTIKKLLNDPSGLLITILVTNEVVNISLNSTIQKSILKNWETTFAPKLVFLDYPNWLLQLLVGVFITTPIILLFCEITPKILGTKANQIIAPLSAKSIIHLYRLLFPVRIIIQGFLSLFLKQQGQKQILTRRQPLLKEDDLLVLLEESHKEGHLKLAELELIKNIFDLDDTSTKTIYTPSSQVVSISVDMTLEKALELSKSKAFSRFPVYKKNKNNIVGILYSKDLIIAKLDTHLLKEKVESIMHPALFVQESMQLNSLFKKMRQDHTHLAIVNDPTNPFLGIVTLSDVLDELFDEYFQILKKIRSQKSKKQDTHGTV